MIRRQQVARIVAFLAAAPFLMASSHCGEEEEIILRGSPWISGICNGPYDAMGACSETRSRHLPEIVKFVSRRWISQNNGAGWGAPAEQELAIDWHYFTVEAATVVTDRAIIVGVHNPEKAPVRHGLSVTNQNFYYGIDYDAVDAIYVTIKLQAGSQELTSRVRVDTPAGDYMEAVRFAPNLDPARVSLVSSDPTDPIAFNVTLQPDFDAWAIYAIGSAWRLSDPMVQVYAQYDSRPSTGRPFAFDSQTQDELTMLGFDWSHFGIAGGMACLLIGNQPQSGEHLSFAIAKDEPRLLVAHSVCFRF